MPSQISHPDLSESQVQWVVSQATRAPSVLNTQPWRFEWDGKSFAVIADLGRGLVVSDPVGRELVISCGAALLNLRLALRHLGLYGRVQVFPDRQDPHLLATVEVVDGPPIDPAQKLWFSALPRRHTHRAQFSDRPLDPALAVRLQEAAESEGAVLEYVRDPGPTRRILDLARTAEALRSSDPEARAEMAQWTPEPTSPRRDGVPARAYSSGPPAAGQGDLAGRDFDLGRDFGRADPEQQPPTAIAALVTQQDLAPDWLQAGQALEAVLLAAAAEWAFASIHSRITEVPNLRAELRRELATAGYPQLLLRFGYAEASATTPRRPTSEVIDLTTRA